jgi:hypothetical protein
MENKKIDPSQVKGWGIDANPKNDPTYPMKSRNNGEHKGYSWQRPTQQPVNIEILHSNERPHVTSVFGTSTPPAGLSGVLRRYAFKYSESSYGHWLPLMAADRIGVAEGVFHDFTRGKFRTFSLNAAGRPSGNIIAPVCCFASASEPLSLLLPRAISRSTMTIDRRRADHVSARSPSRFGDSSFRCC